MNDPNSPQYSASSSQPSELRSNSVSPSSRFMSAPGRARMGSSSMCAYPVNFRETARVPLSNGLLVFEYRWESSTGNLNDLGDCIMGEHVLYPGTEHMPYSPPNPPFDWVEDLNPVVLRVPAYRGYSTDTHGHGPSCEPYIEASFHAVQDYWFHTACMTDPTERIILLGGLIIKRSVYKKNNVWKYKVEKDGISSETNLPIYEARSNPNFSLEKALQKILKIKVGATRAEILQEFEYCGGLHSGHEMVLAYKTQPMIKIRVDFQPALPFGDKDYFLNPDDRITRISKPFLSPKFIL